MHAPDVHCGMTHDGPHIAATEVPFDSRRDSDVRRVYTLGCSSATGEDEALPSAAPWVGLEIIALSGTK